MPSRPLNVIRQLRDGREEIVLEDYEAIATPEEARRAVSLYALERGEAGTSDHLRLATAVARTAIQPNFFYNQLLTGERQRDAQSGVAEVENHVKRGTILVRRGDVLTAAHLDMLKALQDSSSHAGFWSSFVSLLAFSLLLYTCIYHFASGYMRRFSSSQRELEALAFLVLLSLGLGRLTVELSHAFALSGADPAFASSLVYAAPVAGAAMLARLLVNAETAMVLVVLVAVCLGMMMGQALVPTVFFMLSGLTAAGGLVQTRERMQVFKAGALTAVLNVAVVVLLHLATGPLVGGSISVTALGEPGWDAVMAAAGGGLSAVLVLGLVPLFEAVGFVTDYKLQELANMNHPLLRQLMLRAPGTYHHSVMVGSLSEAAAEAIGANGLLARVCSYFHDIGKGLRPTYYIENQRDMPNIHDRLSPERSSQFIIAHVVDGLALGKEHRLPQPVLDNIAMHHGTCIIRFFYQKAVEEAGSAELVDEEKYRHVGPKPNTKEAGIIHLADKVEAACRTLKEPNATTVRGKIQEIVNSVMQEGQLEDCPLTLKELYVIARTFEEVILAIHHHRISYPAPSAGGVSTVQTQAAGQVITLEIPNPLREGEPPDPPCFPEDGQADEPKGSPN
jgi:putative nucleotidyltransferase with HDIG domain